MYPPSNNPGKLTGLVPGCQEVKHYFIDRTGGVVSRLELGPQPIYIYIYICLVSGNKGEPKKQQIKKGS